MGPALGLLLGIEGIRRGSPLFAGLGSLGGVLGGVALQGALAGAAGGVGALAGSGVALAGFLTNPLGLAVLGGIGLVSVIGAILSRGGKKRQATAIAKEGFAQIDQAIRAFELRQTNFDRTIATLNNLWAQMAQGFERIGGSVGRNSIADQQRFFEAKLRHVEEIQRRRNERAGLIGSLPIPEFQVGGLVPGAGSRGRLALLHPGEFVVRRSMVERLGVPKLQSLNQGTGFGDIHINIQTPDKHGVEELIRGNKDLFERAVVSIIRSNVKRGGDLGRLLG